MSHAIKSFEFEVDFNDIEIDDIMQVLLAEGKIYVYSEPLQMSKPGRTWRIAAGANDVFAWNLPESFDIEPDELHGAFLYWQKDPEYGIKVWCIVKMGMMPQARFVQRLVERGIWDLSIYDLSPNKYELDKGRNHANIVE